MQKIFIYKHFNFLGARGFKGRKYRKQIKKRIYLPGGATSKVMLLTSFMVLSIPMVAKFSITSMDFSIFNFTTGTSSGNQRLSTNSTCMPFGKLFPIPKRSLGYLSVPRTSWILLSPRSEERRVGKECR